MQWLGNRTFVLANSARYVSSSSFLERTGKLCVGPHFPCSPQTAFDLCLLNIAELSNSCFPTFGFLELEISVNFLGSRDDATHWQ